MGGCLFAGFGNDRYVEAPADNRSDIATGDAFLGNSMVCGAGGTLLNHEPVETRGIEAMYRRPAVETVTHVGRNTFFARDANESGNESVIAVAVNCGRKADDRCAHPARRQRMHRVFRLAGETGIRSVFFRHDWAFGLQNQGAGRDNQGAVGTFERFPESLDGAAIRFGGGTVVREIMDEGGVNDGVGSSSSTAQAFEIVKRAVMHFCSGGGKRLGRLVGAREAEHLMTRGE